MISEQKPTQIRYRELWSQFFPLALSDVTMALGDPLVSLTLAHLPDARVSLAAVGIAKSQAVFFESPIIMLLHASNALAAKPGSRKTLYWFTLILTTLMSSLCAVLCWEPVFQKVAVETMGVPIELAQQTRLALTILILWPAIIGWRRIFQGLLIHNGFGKAIGTASVARAVMLAGLLYLGYQSPLEPVVLASSAMLIGVFCELAFVIRSAAVHNLISIPQDGAPAMKLKDLFKFYWPLANSMMVVWGGRALLTAVIARAGDGSLALAAWPAAWGLVLLVANSTRMVQQITIRHLHRTKPVRLLAFAASVGFLFTAVLVILSFGPLSESSVQLFLGGDQGLYISALVVLRLCLFIPLMVALQNGFQGFLIGHHRTAWVNLATMCGTATLLITSALLVQKGHPGATSAAVAMSSAILIELFLLAAGCWRLAKLSY